TAEVGDSNLALEPGLDLFVYYELKRKFVKQAARIDAVLQTEPMLVVGFQVTGEPMSAESREWFRVSTVMAHLAADFGPESDCPLLDVSSVGFAVEAAERYEVGQVVPATLSYQDQRFNGKARIQSVRDLGKGRYRYGVHSIEDKESGGDLRKGQQLISAAVEREQLRRRAGTG
ncbi:MAG: PilZ domain-containing protein, partial [Planctomycetota bacterium]